MTPGERAIEAIWDTGAGDWTTIDRERLEMRVEQAINAAIEEKDKRIAELETTLEMFEDGANWERYSGLSDKPEYVWRHDSDPRVLAQDAGNKPDGGTK